MEINTTLGSLGIIPLSLASDAQQRDQPTGRSVGDGGGGGVGRGGGDGGGSGRRVARRKRDTTSPKITPPCTECGKKFWSRKALCGHMRCHPERGWRGINPPPNFKRRSLWPSLTEEDREAAAWLLLMANGNPDAAALEPRRSIRTAKMSSGSRSVTHGANGVHGEEDGVGTTAGGGGGGAVRRFRCWSCSEVYSSQHALVAHKNVTLCGGPGTPSAFPTAIKVEPPSTAGVFSENLEDSDIVSRRNLYGGITLDLRLGF